MKGEGRGGGKGFSISILLILPPSFPTSPAPDRPSASESTVLRRSRELLEVTGDDSPRTRLAAFRKAANRSPYKGAVLPSEKSVASERIVKNIFGVMNDMKGATKTRRNPAAVEGGRRSARTAPS